MRKAISVLTRCGHLAGPLDVREPASGHRIDPRDPAAWRRAALRRASRTPLRSVADTSSGSKRGPTAEIDASGARPFTAEKASVAACARESDETRSSAAPPTRKTAPPNRTPSPPIGRRSVRWCPPSRSPRPFRRRRIVRLRPRRRSRVMTGPAGRLHTADLAVVARTDVDLCSASEYTPALVQSSATRSGDPRRSSAGGSDGANAAPLPPADPLTTGPPSSAAPAGPSPALDPLSATPVAGSPSIAVEIGSTSALPAPRGHRTGLRLIHETTRFASLRARRGLRSFEASSPTSR